MLVSEYKQSAQLNIPEEFLKLLPETCLEETCSSPMEINASLTNLHCSNPRCPIKLKMRMTAMFRSIGVKGIGTEVADGMLKKFRGVTNPLIFMGYESAQDGTLTNSMSMEVSEGIEKQIAERRSYTLWEYVRLAQLPYIQTSALLIFGGYDDLEEAYKDIEAGGIDFIAEKLNIKGAKANIATNTNTEDETGETGEAGEADGTNETGEVEETGETGETGEISVRALNIYETLMTFKKDLFEGLNAVNIIKKNDGSIISLKAVCSDEVGEPFRTKNDFYSTVNSTFAEDIHVDFLSSVNKSIDYLIWAGADGSPARLTNKVKKVTEWNKKYNENKEAGKLKDGDHEIPIVTAKQFIMILEGM